MRASREVLIEAEAHFGKSCTMSTVHFSGTVDVSQFLQLSVFGIALPFNIKTPYGHFAHHQHQCSLHSISVSVVLP